jgi:stress response protein SCP2
MSSIHLKEFSEVITIDLEKLEMSVSYLAILINSFSINGFEGVKSASVTIFQNKNKINESFLEESQGKNAYFAGVVYKTMPTWSFKIMSAVGPGKSYTESEDLIRKNLIRVGFDW